MKLINVNLKNKYIADFKSCACIGFFDGIHLGHKSLIERTVNDAAILGLTPACITFDAEPFSIIKHKSSSLLMTTKDKLSMMEKLGIEVCFLLDFDNDMVNLDKYSFIQLLIELNIKEIVCGEDFSFGAQGMGTPKDIAKMIDTKICPEIMLGKQKISTTLIKSALRYKNIETVNYCLGRNYGLFGKVIRGKQLGKTIGFPTANIKPSADYILPGNGVYAGEIIIDDRTYLAMINIGHNPTFNKRMEISIEAHIIDFDKDIYNKSIFLTFKAFLRHERKFCNKQELIEQLKKDEKAVRDYKGVW